MTDAGEFERLATAVLRRAEPDYAALVHSGVNAQGRPIPSPVDGFGIANSVAPIFVAHTTTAASSLRAKWLNPAEGDIIKAARAMLQLGKSSARLVMTLNRDPALDLVADADAACSAHGLSLDLWSQSRIADFLDDDAEGQWIRRRFFGEPETRLSFSILRDIGQTGPVDLALFDADAALTPRSAAPQLAQQLRNGQKLLLLNAASGQGKTIVAAQIWRDMVSAGAGAIQIAHQDVEASVTLAEALCRALRRRSPALVSICGHAALELAASNEVLVLIEDINRAERPVAALQKIILWSAQLGTTRLRLLCPIWPRAIAGLSDVESKAARGSVTWLSLPNQDEAVAMARAQAAAQGCWPKPNTIQSIVTLLGRDPLLLGLHDYKSQSTDGVRAYVNRELVRQARTSGQLEADLHHALEALARGMLATRTLEPGWHQAQTWLKREEAINLQRLLDAGSLLRVGAESDSDRIVFRHDRVRDHIRASGLRSILRTGEESEVLREPHYAELWGLVLSDPETPDDWIGRAGELNPLGLFYGLANTDAGIGRRATLSHAAATWLDTPDAQSQRHTHLRLAAQFALTEVEGPDAVNLLGRFAETTWWTLETAAWNGDMEAALRITMSWDPHRLTGREKHLFEQIRSHHADAALRFVEEGLRDAAKDRLLALLGLAGRLQDPRLEQALVEAWAKGPHEPSVIDAMLWATTLCAPNRIQPIIEAWAALDDEPLEQGRRPKSSVGYGLRVGFWTMAGSAARDAFVEFAKDLDGPLSWHLSSLLEGWDHPDAQEAFVRLRAHQLTKSRANGGYGLGGSHLGEIWTDDRPRGGSRMSEASLERVQYLWSNPAEGIDVHTVALRLWGYAARPRHLAPTRHLLDPLGPLGQEVVTILIRLEAAEAPEALDALILKDPSRSFLWQWVRGRWRDAYLPYLAKALERLRARRATDTWHNDDHTLPDVMQWLDDDTRERLLAEHWDHIGDKKDWVQLALWTATPASLELARQSLVAGAPGEILKYLDHDYGLYPTGAPATTDLRRLQALEPWIDSLRESALSRLEEHCNRLGWRDWRRTHIDCRLEAGEKAPWRSPTARREAFDKLAAKEQRRRHVHFTIKQMVEMEGSFLPILDELEVWLKERKDLAALHVACDCVIDAATRPELSRIEAWRSLGLPGGVDLIDDAIFAVKRRSLI